jgi:hypothetical protein
LKLRNANFTETGTPNNQFSAGQLNRFSLAYLHVIEPRIKGYPLVVEGQPPVASERLRQVFEGKIIAAGGLSRTPLKQLSRRATSIWSRLGAISFLTLTY